MFEKIETFLQSFDIEECQKNKEIADLKKEELSNFVSELAREDEQKQRYIKKEGLLKEVPCGSEYSHCKFIKDAYTAVDSMQESNKKMSELSIAINQKGEEIQEYDYQKLDEHIGKYNKVLTKKNNIATELANDQIKFEKNKAELVRQNVSLRELQNKQGEYEENKEAIENLELLIEERASKHVELLDVKKQLTACNNLILELYKQHGSLEQKLKSLTSQKEELDSLREEFAAYDLFTTCMHSNGISYDIIKKKLPVINDEISKVLANVVDFESFFESEGNKLDIFIKHPKFDPRPIEMGSGAEKTIVAMAIRLALLSISSLPKSNIFILDEPATALDEDNMEGFIRILDMVKSYYQTVLLISHVDSLKDIADMTIEIEKKNGFAFVNH